MTVAWTDPVSVVKKQVVFKKDNLILLRNVNFTLEFFLEIQSFFIYYFFLASIYKKPEI